MSSTHNLVKLEQDLEGRKERGVGGRILGESGDGIKWNFVLAYRLTGDGTTHLGILEMLNAPNVVKLTKNEHFDDQ